MFHLKAHKLIPVFLFFLAISFPKAIFAGTLNFSPAEEILYFGEVFAYEKEYLEQGKLMFTMTATSGSCTHSITYGDPYPPVDVRMGTVAATIADGDSMPIWIWLSCEVPGDHDLHLIIDSTCGTFHRTIKFTCIGYAVVEGNVLDRFSRNPVLDASVDALSYYLTVSMRGGGFQHLRGCGGSCGFRRNAVARFEYCRRNPRIRGRWIAEALDSLRVTPQYDLTKKRNM